MIDIVDYRRQIERARALLGLHEAVDSLSCTHALDKGVPVTYQSKYSLLQWIDRWTIERAESILRNDLKGLHESENILANQMFEVYSNFARTISTTKDWYHSKGAIYKTIFDCRYLRKFLPKDFNILDFGPGCGRHAITFYLKGNNGIYAGIDCVEVLYLLQNAVMSYISPKKTFEYLDFVLENENFPEFSELPPGSMVHIPSCESKKLDSGSFDVLIACHVLDELPRGDFDRLLDISKKCLKPNGIIYARGTFQNPGKMKLPRYHGYDILNKFKEIGFIPIVNDYYPNESYNVVVLRRQG